MDPSRNNMPLQFNMNKNKPPMPVTRTNNGERKEDDAPSSTTHNAMMGGGDKGGQNNGNNPMMGMVSMGNMMGPMVQGPMASNPGMVMMDSFGNMQGPMMGGPGMMGPMGQNMMGGQGPQNMMGGGPQAMMGGGPQAMMGGGPQAMMSGGGPPGMMGQGPQGGMMGGPSMTKEVITLKSCVLYPPTPGTPQRGTRERPPGCRTIFVGGLPENITEEILAEVFQNCGPVDRIRISKKKFSHVRFENMQSVDEALYISGYRMKIKDSDVAEDTGRIHVDYAEARDDQHEFECLQRAMAREMRHQQRVQAELTRPPSPQPIVRFSEHEAVQLLEKMKSDDNFLKVSQMLINWLERGECNRRTANTFYALVQNVHGNLRRVTNELHTINTEFDQYKIQHESRLQGMIGQICQVERVLSSAHKQKNWDHFSKAQRKNILTWQRQAQDMRNTNDTTSSKDDNLASDDMELSDDDVNDKPVISSSSSKKRKSSGGSTEKANDDKNESMENLTLRAQKQNLQYQLEAFKNEVEVLKKGASDDEEKDKQITALQNALQGMQQQLISQRTSVASLTQDKNDLERKLRTLEVLNASKESVSKDKSAEKDSPSETSDKSSKEEVAVTSSGMSISDKEAKMIGLISCFLNVHPGGATVDYLWSYLSQVLSTVRVREVEDLLEKMPSIFVQKIVGVGATIERKWTFTALTQVL